MAKAKKNVKAKGKKEAAEKPAKKASKPAKLTDSSSVSRTSKARSGGGPKGKLYALVPKKGGIKLKALLKTAESELELKPKKATAWLNMMIGNGFLTAE